MTATVTISVEESPTTFALVDDAYTTAYETPLAESAPGVLANDTVPIGTTVALNMDVSHGSLTLNADGSFTYTPDAGFSGTDSFRYTAQFVRFAGVGEQADPTAMVTITVQGAPGQPTPEPTPMPTPIPPTPVPGCDAFIQVPANAAGGRLLQTTVAHWAPGNETNPQVVLEGGKSVLVLQRNAAGTYYQVLWQCTRLWLPVEVVGPNYDYPWNGTPLP